METIEQESITDQLTDEQIDQLWATEIQKQEEMWEIVYESGEWCIM